MPEAESGSEPEKRWVTTPADDRLSTRASAASSHSNDATQSADMIQNKQIHVKLARKTQKYQNRDAGSEKGRFLW